MEIRYKCVKEKLKNVVRDQEVSVKIESIVNNIHKMTTQALFFIKLYFIWLRDNNKSLPKLNRDFLATVLKTIASKTFTCGPKLKQSNQELKELLSEFYNTHYSKLQKEKLVYSANYNNSIEYAIRTILTCFTVNLKMNVKKYIKQYINTCLGLKHCLETCETEDKPIVYKLFRDIEKDVTRDETEECISDPMFHELISEMRNIILPKTSFKKKNIHYDIAACPLDYLITGMTIASELECFGDQVKLYKVFPLRTSEVIKYIRIDMQVLQKVFKIKESNKQKVIETFFKTEMKLFRKTNGYVFNGLFETDSVGISIIFEKEVEKCEASDEMYIHEIENTDEYKSKQVVAIDPNMSDLIYCINDNGDKFRYTKNQVRKETRTKKYQRIIQKLKTEDIRKSENELAKYNSKTMDFGSFKKYIETKNIQSLTSLNKFYSGNQLSRKLKLNTYINRQRSEAVMTNTFKEIFGKPEKTIIAFGDWAQYEHRKFQEPVKGKGFRKLFRHCGYSVFLVDEYKTSCQCSSCCTIEARTEKFLKVSNPRPWKKTEAPTVLCHGLVRCKSCTKLWNRDTNAAINIHTVAKEWINKKSRPEYLSRSNSV